MKRLAIGLLAVLPLVASAPASNISAESGQSSSYYVGSKHSNKFHYPWCRWAKKIKPYNLITFDTPEQAATQGYIPCKVCNPPVSSKRSDVLPLRPRSFKISEAQNLAIEGSVTS